MKDKNILFILSFTLLFFIGCQDEKKQKEVVKEKISKISVEKNYESLKNKDKKEVRKIVKKSTNTLKKATRDIAKTVTNLKEQKDELCKSELIYCFESIQILPKKIVFYKDDFSTFKEMKDKPKTPKLIELAAMEDEEEYVEVIDKQNGDTFAYIKISDLLELNQIGCIKEYNIICK